MTDDTLHRLDRLVITAEHKGACGALLAAMTLLRRLGYRDAADLLLEHVSELTPEVKPIEEVRT